MGGDSGVAYGDPVIWIGKNALKICQQKAKPVCPHFQVGVSFKFLFKYFLFCRESMSRKTVKKSIFKKEKIAFLLTCRFAKLLRLVNIFSIWVTRKC